LILDLMLPARRRLRGVEEAARLDHAAAAVIVVTAYVSTKEVVEVQKDPNVALFLSKPINQNKLLEACTASCRPRLPAQAYTAPKTKDEKKG